MQERLDAFNGFSNHAENNFITWHCVSGIVGEIEETGDGFYIWTHKKFDIGFTSKQIVDVNLTSEVKVKLAPGIKIPFSYEVSQFIFFS